MCFDFFFSMQTKHVESIDTVIKSVDIFFKKTIDKSANRFICSVAVLSSSTLDTVLE